ncbi:MAG: hypothetical protein OXC02_02000 [Rhodobacteraceae bacterium]|nr:hypothetical protein [Paracoccaceae bacterium]
MRIAVFPIGRSTFDLEYASEAYQKLRSILHSLGIESEFPNEILSDELATQQFIHRLKNQDFSRILVFQATFTDSLAVCSIAEHFNEPLSIIAVQEPRLRNRLRLNSFCGLNLASHALGLRSHPFNWLYEKPENFSKEAILNLLTTQPTEPQLYGDSPKKKHNRVQANNLVKLNIGVIGEHPPGFDTCKFESSDLKKIFNTTVQKISLNELFEKAKQVNSTDLIPLIAQIKEMKGAKDVNQAELIKSLKLKIALDQLADGKDLSGFAIRCWPETFTQYGGAVCGPVSLMGDEHMPCACEADVFGALSQLWIKHLVNEVSFLVDVVDMDVHTNSGVVWHCGQAPLSMCNPQYSPEITIHTNRQKPLLFQFPLKAGVITLFRVSQSLGQYRIVVIKAEVIDAPIPFTGTSGTIKFKQPVAEVLKEFLHQRIEHHLVLVYGDHRQKIIEFASTHNLPVIEI